MFKIKEIYVRFIGNYVLNKKTSESILYFTGDMNSHITECNINYYTVINDKKFKKIINRMYSKKENDPLDFSELNNLDENSLSKEFIKQLNRKIIMFRYGQTIKALVNNKRIIEFVDFYPKSGVFDAKLLYSISKKMYNTVSQSEYYNININSSILVSACEGFNSLLRYPLTIDDDYKIHKFIKENYNKLDKIEDLFLQLSCIGVDYTLEREKNISLLNEKKDYIFSELRKHTLLIRNLYLQYKDFIKENYKDELYKIFVPKIDGKEVNVSEKIIKKTNIKAHKRNATRMSDSKRQEILAILEERNLEIEGISKIITKENFDEFQWESMTIVDSFDKNVMINKKNTIVDEIDYRNKELEKQRRLEESNFVHNKLIRKMTFNIKHNNYILLYSRFIDLFFKNQMDELFIFEMKSIKNEKEENNEYSQIMKAYSQLELYPFIHKFYTNIMRCVVLSEKPKDKRLIDFLRFKDIDIIWLENDIFITMNWCNSKLKEFLYNQVVIK